MTRDKRTNRKYYLHRVIRKFSEISVKKKEVSVSANMLDFDHLGDRRRKYLKEISEKYGYNLQLTMIKNERL